MRPDDASEGTLLLHLLSPGGAAPPAVARLPHVQHGQRREERARRLVDLEAALVGRAVERAEDQQRVVDALESSTDAKAKAVAELMKTHVLETA